MLPASSIMRAAERWLRILRTSTLDQAWMLIRANPGYTDLTQTQYGSALEWLIQSRLLIRQEVGVGLAPMVEHLPHQHAKRLLFEHALESAAPAWLPDADLLIPDVEELPQDVAGLAEALGILHPQALLYIRQVQWRIDLAKRERVGSAGERALVELLEAHWPGSVTHVALHADGLGYDIVFRYAGTDWHLEVKSTTRRGRLVIHLTRHEHEVGLQDPYWRLVAVGLDDELRLRAFATVQHSKIAARAPADHSIHAVWQSVAHELAADDLWSGLHLHGQLLTRAGFLAGKDTPAQPMDDFAWLPKA